MGSPYYSRENITDKRARDCHGFPYRDMHVYLFGMGWVSEQLSRGHL